MKVVIRCTEDRMYNFVFAKVQFDHEMGSFVVEDRNNEQHYFPTANVIHIQASKDEAPAKRGL